VFLPNRRFTFTISANQRPRRRYPLRPPPPHGCLLRKIQGSLQRANQRAAGGTRSGSAAYKQQGNRVRYLPELPANLAMNPSGGETGRSVAENREPFLSAFARIGACSRKVRFIGMSQPCSSARRPTSQALRKKMRAERRRLCGLWTYQSMCGMWVCPSREVFALEFWPLAPTEQELSSPVNRRHHDVGSGHCIWARKANFCQVIQPVRRHLRKNKGSSAFCTLAAGLGYQSQVGHQRDGGSRLWVSMAAKTREVNTRVLGSPWS